MESNFLKADKLEKLLIANWADFLNSSKIMGYILKIVQENTERFVIFPETKKPKGVSITLSRCEWTCNGFIIWAEFSVPLDKNKIAEGTSELCLTCDGSLTHLSTTGNIFIAN